VICSYIFQIIKEISLRSAGSSLCLDVHRFDIINDDAMNAKFDGMSDEGTYIGNPKLSKKNLCLPAEDDIVQLDGI
jgi:hypothetical protein